jgi:hypothetical protein
MQEYFCRLKHSHKITDPKNKATMVENLAGTMKRGDRDRAVSLGSGGRAPQDKAEGPGGEI